MKSPHRDRFPVLLIAVACLALVVFAVFSGGVSAWKDATWQNIDIEERSLLSLFRADPQPVGDVMAMERYACPRCGVGVGWGSLTCPGCGQSPTGGMTLVALPCAPPGSPLPCAPNGGPLPCAPQGTLAAAVVTAAVPTVLPAGPTPGLTGPDATTVNRQQAEVNPADPAAIAAQSSMLSPREQNAAGKEFIEGHWLGLEVIPLTPELAAEYRIPKGENGILVDEITLESAESGILAGDMVQTVDGRPTPDLKAFFVATQRVQEKERADVGVSRRGEKMTFFMEARNTKTLGFAQMEAAQPIKPGALSPHRLRSKACTECHIIMKTGGQLPTDAGDILPNPPAITKAAIAIHGDRGPCAACHVIK